MRIATIDCCYHSAYIIKDKTICCNCLKEWPVSDNDRLGCDIIFPKYFVSNGYNGPCFVYEKIDGWHLIINLDGQHYWEEYRKGEIPSEYKSILPKHIGIFLEGIYGFD